MKIKCNKKEFKLEIFIIVLSIVSILIHLYKIIFMHDKLNTELIITLIFLILVIVAIIFLLNRIYIKVNRGKLYVSSLDLVNKRILKDSINIKDIEKYGFSTDLKLNYNKYDIVLQSKNKKLIIPVNQFKNKDILRLLELIEDKTNIKPTGLAKYLRETKK
ncbi:unknown [Clostridium sp. CAG:524]|nr:unknown [Clostridium sp. CAG:524]